MEAILLVWLILWLFNTCISWPKPPYKEIVNSCALVLLIIWLVLILMRAPLRF